MERQLIIEDRVVVVEPASEFSKSVADMLERISAAPYGEAMDRGIYLQVDTAHLGRDSIAFLKDVGTNCAGTTGVSLANDSLYVHFDAGVSHVSWVRDLLMTSFAHHVREVSEVDAALLRAANVATQEDRATEASIGAPGLYSRKFGFVAQWKESLVMFMQSLAPRLFETRVELDCERRERMKG